MPGRPLLVLVILAALSGAPSPASAAGNDLSAPSVSPTAGSISTVFSFGVGYDGKFDATAVSVQVAGRTLVMHLVAGTPLSGTWSVASTLPAGTWPVTFLATTDRGNPPTLTGPTVTVTGPSTPPPPEPASSVKATASTPLLRQGTEMSSSPGTEAGDGSSPDPRVVAPEASQAPTPGASSEMPPSAGGGSGQAGTLWPGSAGAPASTPDAGTGGGTGAAEEGAAAPADGLAAKLASDARAADDGLVVSVLLIGLAGVAAVALAGTAILLAGRRRNDEEDEAAPAAAADMPTALERRAVRRPKVRLNEDPIVAAMGLGEDDKPRTPRGRAGQVASGPGERPRRTGRS